MANPTIGATTPRIQYTATASQTVFTVPFEFLANADLAVYVNGTLKTLTTDYTLTGANTTGGGTLTFVTGRTAGDIVTILGNLAYSRDTNKYTKYGLLPAEVLEADFDAMQVQAKQLARDGQFALRAPLTDTGSPSMTLPAVATRASKALGFDASGNPTVSASSLADIDSTVQIIDALNALPAGASSSISYQPAGTGAVTTTVQAKLRETVSVKDFGAVGDGVTDDTAAIQAAFNAAAKIYFPAGTYKLTSRVAIPSNRVIFAELATIYGTVSVAGTVTVLGVKFLVDNSLPFGATPEERNIITSASALTDVRFINCALTNNCTTTSGTGGAVGLIYTSHAISGIQFINCEFTAPATLQNGIKLVAAGTDFINNVLIDGCNFHDIGRMACELWSSGAALASAGVKIVNNRFYNTGTIETSLNGMAVSLSMAHTDALVDGNTFDTIYGYCIEIYGSNVRVTRNSIVNCTHNHFVTCSGATAIQYCIVSNNNFSGGTATTRPLQLTNFNYGVISNNVFNNCASIELTGINNNIFGNVFRNDTLTTSWCIALKDAQKNLVYGNLSVATTPPNEFVRLNGATTASNISVGNYINISSSGRLYGVSGGPAAQNDFSISNTNILAQNFVQSTSGTKTTDEYVYYTWDPASIASGASLTSPGISVTFSTYSRFIKVLPPYDLQGITATAYLSGTSTAKIVLQNSTGAAIDLASGTWRLMLSEI